MRRVIDFYRLQIKVMREWQPTVPREPAGCWPR